MEEKRSEPTVIVQQIPPAYHATSTGTWKTSSNVRLLIIAVSAMVIVGMVVTGFILGFKNHADVTEIALTSMTETLTRKNEQETIETSDDGLIKTYTVEGPEGEYSVLYDYNKNIRLVKKEDQCVVTPLNSSEVDPKTAFERQLPSTGESGQIWMRDSMPVRDTSFLGVKGQELCEGNLVYWAMPTCGNDGTMYGSNTTSVAETGRHKRQTTFYHGPCSQCCIYGVQCPGTLCSYVSYVCVFVVELYYGSYSDCFGYVFYC